MAFARLLPLLASLGAAAGLTATGDQINKQVNLTAGPAVGQLKVCSSRTGKFYGTTFTIKSNNHITAIMQYTPADITTAQSTMDPGSSSTLLPLLVTMDAYCNGNSGCTVTKTLASTTVIDAGTNTLCLLVSCWDSKASDGGGAGDISVITYSVTFGAAAPAAATASHAPPLTAALSVLLTALLAMLRI